MDTLQPTSRAAVTQGWRWRAARVGASPSVDLALLTREDRMDRDRRTQALDRLEEVVVGCLARDAEMSLAPRVMLAVQQEWFGTTLRAALTQRGIEVLDVVTDGADAVGRPSPNSPTSCCAGPCSPG